MVAAPTIQQSAISNHQLDQRKAFRLLIADCGLLNVRRGVQIRNPQSAIRNPFTDAHITELPTRFLRTTPRHATSDSLAAARRRLRRAPSLFSRDYLSFAPGKSLLYWPLPAPFRSPRLSFPLRPRRQAHRLRSKR